MAEEIKPTDKADGFQDPATNNAEVAAKLVAQDAAGHSMAPVAKADTGEALDALAAEKTKEKAAAEAEVAVEPKKEDAPAPDPAAEAAKKAADEAAAKKSAEDTAAAEATKKTADELFKGTELPSSRSPRSAEAFEKIKTAAAQEIIKRDKQIAELTTKQTELEAKLKNPVPKELLDEVENLRQFRAKLDVEADPKFKEFDQNVSKAHEFVYAKLKATGLFTDDHITAIKKYGGPENVDLDKLFAKMNDPHTQRLIETKIGEIETIKFNKSQAIEETKKNIGEYLKTRTEETEKARTAHNSTTVQHLNEYAGALPWFKDRQPDANADDAAKAAVVSHNKFVAEVKQQMETAINDDSPAMRATLLTGMAQLFYIQRVHEASIETNKALTKERDELRVQVDRLKDAGSTHRLRASNAPVTPKVEAAKTMENQMNVPTTQALDEIRDRIVQTRSAAAAGQ